MGPAATADMFQKNAVKAGDLPESRKAALRVTQSLVERGAEAVIAGCTEVPLILSQEDLRVPFVDATNVRVRAAVGRAREVRTHV